MSGSYLAGGSGQALLPQQGHAGFSVAAGAVGNVMQLACHARFLQKTVSLQFTTIKADMFAKSAYLWSQNP